MSSVKSLTITGYKSIRELKNFPLTNLNVLIGANGAGKSNFISLFRLLNEMVNQNLQLYVQVQGGPDAILHFGRQSSPNLGVELSYGGEIVTKDFLSLLSKKAAENSTQTPIVSQQRTDVSLSGLPERITFTDSYKFSLTASLDNRLLFANEAIRVTSNEARFWSSLAGVFFGFLAKNPLAMIGGGVLGAKLPELFTSDVQLGSGHEETKLQLASVEDLKVQLVLRFVGSLRVYHFHDMGDKAKVKQRHATNDNLCLKPDAANLAAYLRMLYENHQAHYQRIVETIRLVAPFFGDFVYRPGAVEYIELEWMQKGRNDTPFKALHLSDGTLRFICLATLLLQPTELLPDTILIDEPELGLHPYAISVLADIFKQVSENKQLIVSTQSVELVNEIRPEDVIVVEQENEASSFKRFTSQELAGWLEEYAMGELWKRNILGGRP